MKLITDALLLAWGHYFNKVLENSTKVVVYIIDVTTEGYREIYSSNNDYLIKFGVVVASEVLLSNNKVNSRNILKA